jgi:MoxR-like ATPase
MSTPGDLTPSFTVNTHPDLLEQSVIVRSAVHNGSRPMEPSFVRGRVDSLSELLRGDLADERHEINELDGLIRESKPVLVDFFFKDSGEWPYRLVDDSQAKLAGYSQSTTAMVAFALAALAGHLRDSQLIAAQPQIGDFFADAASNSIVGAAITGLVQELSRTRLKGEVRTTSGTFGHNDPFTLYWVLELLAGRLDDDLHDSRPDQQALRGEIRDGIIEAALNVALKALVDPSRPVLKRLPRKRKTTFIPVLNTLPLLRALQLGKLLQRHRPDLILRLDRVRDHFFTQLYQQASYSEIKDSAFDVAELVFALEGVLVCDPEAVNEAVLERALTVVHEIQDVNPNWRPLRPFRVTEQGGVHTPVSIEVANSLLRVIDLSDRYRPTAKSFARHRGMFRRYTEWLRSTRISGTAENEHEEVRQFRGWQSEHAYSPTATVHLWETSQVLLYFFNYSTLLRRHLAATALEEGGFSWSTPSQPLKPRESWGKWEQGEPLADLKNDLSPYRVYSDIGRSFVAPRANGPASGPSATAKYSFLLYGPPGTGKTTVAEQLAAALKWRLITITPSDFVVRGEAEVEARAKAIFDVLQLQTDCVILFDEIDRLLLDRDSKAYSQQREMFQFMTPGMLTKLNDLRRRKRSIFIIATNYADRIDSAITRPGRLDAHYLLLPPNLAQRRRILDSRLSKLATLNDADEKKIRRDLVQSTALYTWTELVSVIRRAEELLSAGEDITETVRTACSDVPPNIKLSPYMNRRLAAADLEPPDRLLEELFLLAYLAAEVDMALPQKDLTTLHSHWEKNKSLVRDEQVKGKLNEYLKPRQA